MYLSWNALTRAKTRTSIRGPCFEGAPLPRWLASWRRDFEGYEIVAKVGDALAVANQDHSLSGGSGGGMSINGGVINTAGGHINNIIGFSYGPVNLCSHSHAGNHTFHSHQTTRAKSTRPTHVCRPRVKTPAVKTPPRVIIEANETNGR